MRQTAQENPGETTPRRRWFTLTELLVLVAIVCILLAVLWPRFARVKAPALQVTCLSNVRKMCVAFRIYAEDNADRLPRCRGWADAMLPYLDNREVLTCPVARDTWPGYAYHPPVAGRQLKSFERLEETVLIYDGKDGKLARRHAGGADYGFAAGYARWQRDPPSGYFADGGLAPRSRCSPTTAQ